MRMQDICNMVKKDTAKKSDTFRLREGIHVKLRVSGEAAKGSRSLCHFLVASNQL